MIKKSTLKDFIKEHDKKITFGILILDLILAGIFYIIVLKFN